MAKKILILSGSPRLGGNSERLCLEFARGAREVGHEVELVYLAEKEIAYCDGCNACAETHRCIHDDDMTDILQAMIDADAIVLATPVYFYTMDAQLKTVIDRTCCRYTEISDKDFYFIITAADTDLAKLQLTVETLRGFTDWCLPNPRERGVIIAEGVWKVGEIDDHPAMGRAYEMGKAV